LIRNQALQYLKGLEGIGLTPKLLTVQEDGGENIHIKLERSGHCLATKRHTDEDKKRSLLYTLMANNVSFKIYHEIASLFPPLPRAHEVNLITQAYTIYQSFIIIFIFVQMKQLRDRIKILPVENTNHNEIEGAECDFVKLLTETVQRLVSL